MEITTVGTTVLEKARGTLTTDDISKFKLNTDPPKAITISGGGKGIIASANMSATVNGQLVYYASLADAIAAATGTQANPAVILLMDDIDVSASIAVDNGKHIKIIPAGESDGDTVTIKRGSGNTSRLFNVGGGASLTLAGNGSAQLVLDGESQSPSENGSLVYVPGGSLVMEERVTLQNNVVARDGGGVYIESGTFTMNGGLIQNNSAIGGGGVYVAQNGSVFNFLGGEIKNNTAGQGGGIAVVSGTVYMSGDAKVTGNETTAQAYNKGGGGVFLETATASFIMSGGTIEGNSSNAKGGGVYVGGTFTMTGGEISDNTAAASIQGNGGGVYVKGTFFMSGGTISDNTAKLSISSEGQTFGHGGGGGVYVDESGSFTMSADSTISRNTSNGEGGGGGVYVYGNGATFTMEGGTISNNNASRGGGGVSVYGAGATFTMSGGTISGNETNGDYAGGGGVLVTIGGMFTMEGGSSKISGNTAYSKGGGGVCVDGADTTFTMNGGTIYGVSEGTNSNTASSGSAALYKADDAISNKSTTDNTITIP
jgi:hypothetical protein